MAQHPPMDARNAAAARPFQPQPAHAAPAQFAQRPLHDAAAGRFSHASFAHAGMGAGRFGAGPSRDVRPAAFTRPDQHDAATRGGESHDLPHDDPARAHGRFDEQVRDDGRERDIARLHSHDFHVRDVRGFNDHEWHMWRAGAWQHDYFNGRFGWWYDVGGVYYPYAEPYWPYPLYVAPLIAADVPGDAPLPAGVPVLPALPRAAYHCASPSGFYPSVDTCGTGWITLASH